MDEIITQGLSRLSLQRNVAARTHPEISGSLPGLDFDFKPIYSLIKFNKGFLDHFILDPPENIPKKFLEAGKSLSAINYKSVLKLAILTEFWHEKSIADNNTDPHDTFFKNVPIEVRF